MIALFQTQHFSFASFGKFTICLCLGFSISAMAQQTDPFQIIEMAKMESPVNKKLFSKLEGNNTVALTQADTVLINSKIQRSLLQHYNTLVEIPLPFQPKNETYYFTEFDFFSPDYQVNLIGHDEVVSVFPKKGTYLKGSTLDGHGMATMSLFETAIYGNISSPNGGWKSILPLDGQSSGAIKCIVTEEDPLKVFQGKEACSTDDFRDYIGNEITLAGRLGDNCKIVEISINVDYDLYIKFNKNVQSISNYVTGLFNNVHSLYKREGINISIAQLNIHSSEDQLTHINASADLETFRKKNPNTNKTVRLLLSGYSKNGTAPLGGIAYINTVCLSSYSYAYANVNGTFEQTPSYSWDVFVVTHELGHTFGSRHTHACVWGPKKNQAIDHCQTLEGSCPSPGLPLKGTMMSYCYQTGKPGIDLNLGFGKEPGDLIRATLQNSSCLKSNSPEGKALNQNNTVLTANVECFDGIYTHYYFDNNTIDGADDVLLLSIMKDTQKIGSLMDSSLTIKQITTLQYATGYPTDVNSTALPNGTSFSSGNKFWLINSKFKPVSPLNIQCLISAKDISDLKGTASQIDTSTIQWVQMTNKSNIDPRTQWQNADASNTTFFTKGNFPTQNQYSFTKLSNGNYLIELRTSQVASMGFGLLKSQSSFVNFKSVNGQSENQLTQFSLETSHESGCKRLIIEKLNASNTYDSLTQVIANGNLASLYPVQYAKAFSAEDIFRVRAVSNQGQQQYSQNFSVTVVTLPVDQTIYLYPNPVTSGRLNFEYNHSGQNEKITVRISDTYGKILRTYSLNAQAGNNKYTVSTYGLKSGLHQLTIVTKTSTLKSNFTIGQ